MRRQAADGGDMLPKEFLTKTEEEEEEEEEGRCSRAKRRRMERSVSRLLRHAYTQTSRLLEEIQRHSNISAFPTYRTETGGHIHTESRTT